MANTYTPLGTHNDSSLSASEAAQVKQYQQQYVQVKNQLMASGMSEADANKNSQLQQLHAAAEAVRANAASGGYSGGSDGSDYIPIQKQPTVQSATSTWQPNTSNVKNIERVDTAQLQATLKEIVDQQKQQQELGIDYATSTAELELARALEDAAKQYQTQRNQISADEAKAKDNQALYADMRGDNGGIGAAQYDAIANTAALNHQTVNQSQIKLSTDTQRQIADLRAQGEFEKADKLLSLTQSYLSQLMQLEQWAMETNLSVDEFNAQLEQWRAEYDLSVQQYLTDKELSEAQLTGSFSDGRQTLAAKEMIVSQLSSAGEAMLSLGIMPSASQLEAMGMTAEQAQAYITAAKAQSYTGGGGGGSETTEAPTPTYGTYLDAMAAAGIADLSSAKAWLQANSKSYNIDSEYIESYAEEYMDYAKANVAIPNWAHLSLTAQEATLNILHRRELDKQTGKYSSPITASEQAKLEKMRLSGEITNSELNFILDYLGV